jgi:hypothetical protein
MATATSSCSRRGCHLAAGQPGGLCGLHDVAEREARLRRLGFTEGQLDALLDAGFDVPAWRALDHASAS